MEIEPQIFAAQVMHHRHKPKKNGFTYKSSYLSLPLQKNIQTYPEDSLAINRFSFLSFYEKDHGNRDGSDLYLWAEDILKQQDLHKVTEQIILVTLPRIFGYVFNPVSFWLCLDKDNKLRALISEVNNTFGESHTYLCAKSDHQPISSREWLSSEKLFYVSPFLEREGGYKYRISFKENKLGIWVNHFDKQEKLLLSTSLIGDLKPMSKKALRHSFLLFPFTAVKTISLIHWQALKLWFKGVKYVSRPEHGRPSKSSHLEKTGSKHHFHKKEIGKAAE